MVNFDRTLIDLVKDALSALSFTAHRVLVIVGMTESGSNSVVECQLPKLDVAGSNPVSRSIFSTTLQNPASF
jgi:hypothetical protein